MSGTKLFLLMMVGLIICQSQWRMNWMDQGNWGGMCQNGEWQSPIDIDTKEVEFCPINHWVHFEAPC